MNLLSVNDLTIAFPAASGRWRSVARGISFGIARGEKVAIVGESGAGKSMVARSLVRLLPPGGETRSGSILFDGQDICNLADDAVRSLRGRRIAMVFQDPLAGLNPLHRIGEQIAETLRLNSGLRGTELRRRVLELLDMVCIENPEEKALAYPHQLSGGQRQRVMIAMAVANRPDLLIADEPTTALDATVQREILLLLDRLRQELNMAVLIISHDLRLIRGFADTVHVMRHGKIVESGPVDELFSSPRHPYTRELLGADTGDWPEAPIPGETLLEVKGLSVRFPRPRTSLFKRPAPFVAVKELAFSLRRGECLGLVGESGSGKSTTAMAILRLIASQGSIRFRGQEISCLSHRQMAPLRSKIQVVFQDPFSSLDPRMSVGDIIAEGLHVHMPSRKDFSNEVAEVLTEVGLPTTYAARFPHEMSGGERQRVAIARALVLKPEVLILDEPTSSLDRSLQFQIMELLRELQYRRNMACLYISHDLSLVRRFCGQVIVMKNGICVERGTTRKLFATPKSDYLRQLLNAAGLSAGSDSQHLQHTDEDSMHAPLPNSNQLLSSKENTHVG
ncbi:MAG: ABC transporter ATP-binding protein [Mailhella sp.]|nr:ABC transporter ATP-binding protein [Mailhella sp.]